MRVGIFFRTLPYLFLRLVVYALFGGILLLALVIIGGVGFVLVSLLKESAAAPVIILAIITVPILWALIRLFQRYALYLVRGGHIAVITELVKKGQLSSGQGQIAFGKDKVLKHFGSASVLFAVDQVVRQAVKQILSWLTSALGCLGQIPGVGLVVSFVRRVLSISANYIDEAILSYIMSHEEGKNVWEVAADGVVLYAQSWKELLKTAALLVLLVMAIWLAAFVVFLSLFLVPAVAYGESIAKSITADPTTQSGLRFLFGIIALVFAWIVANVARWVLVDPLATVSMIVSYNQAIEGVQPSTDLYGQLVQVSRKFRELSARAKQSQPPA